MPCLRKVRAIVSISGPVGTVRLVPSCEPPMEPQPWMLIQSNSSISSSIRPWKPLCTPRTMCPWSMASRAAAWTAVFMPGADAPAVRIASRKRRWSGCGGCGSARLKVRKVR